MVDAISKALPAPQASQAALPAAQKPQPKPPIQVQDTVSLKPPRPSTDTANLVGKKK